MTATRKTAPPDRSVKIYKSGANYRDRNAIAAHAEQGDSAEEISLKLGIALQCVENFMPKTEAEADPAPKPAAKKVTKKAGAKKVAGLDELTD